MGKFLEWAQCCAVAAVFLGLSTAAHAAKSGGNPPDVSIISPIGGLNFESGISIPFEGTASSGRKDLDANLVWTSDSGVQIGTGGTFSTTLSLGAHTVTASATWKGQTGTATVTLTVIDAGPSNQAPLVGSLSAGPEPVQQGQTLTLTANGVSDPNGSVAGVSFYRDDGDGLFNPGAGADALLGTDSDGADGWSLAVGLAWDFAVGSYRYFAQATDDGVPAPVLTSNVVAATSTVIAPNQAPLIGSLTLNPDS